MRLERIPEYVTIAVVIACGIGFALFAGRFAGTGQLGLILLMLSAIAVTTTALTLRKAIWLLIPVGWLFEGQIPELPLPFAVRDLTVGIVFVTYGAFVALKVVRVKPKIGVLDLLVFANITYLAITYLRNPVGFDALGSARVGGRPYFNVFISIAAYLVLRRVTPTVRDLKMLPWLIAGANLLIGTVNLVAFMFPWTAPILNRFYTGISQDAYNRENSLSGGDPSDNERLNQLSGFGVTASTLLCAVYRPITLVFPWFPGRFIIFMFSMIAVAFSGHRSALLYVMLAFGLASYYRGRMRDFVHVGIAGVGILAVLVLAQGRLIELPFAVQRTLSWLPGDWNYQATADAQHSTEWRVEMWKIALTDSNYIENKILGDGFGFTQWDLALISQAQLAHKSGIATGLTEQEIALRVGNYHSGPITAIKFVGIVGSVLYYALFIGAAAYAHRLVLRSRDTPLFTSTLFLCIPNIYFPFVYIFVFGAFDTALPVTFMSVGLLQAIGRGLDEFHKATHSLPLSLDPARSPLLRPAAPRLTSGRQPRRGMASTQLR